MSSTATCVLPGGYLDERGVCHRGVTIAALRGRDEDVLRRLPATARVAWAVTEILSLVVRSVGPHRMTRDIAEALTPVDRDYLLLKLWQLSFASRVEMVLTCPSPTCGSKMDVDFDIDDISLEARPQQPSYAARVAGRDVTFRIPRAVDVEMVAARGLADPVAALVARCVCSIDGHDGAIEQALAECPSDLRSAIEGAIERACPRLGLDLEAVCPECGARFDAAYDPAATLLFELHRTHGELQRHVHLLSFHYHWPLREILGMPRTMRQGYVRLLLTELGGLATAQVSPS